MALAGGGALSEVRTWLKPCVGDGASKWMKCFLIPAISLTAGLHMHARLCPEMDEISWVVGLLKPIKVCHHDGVIRLGV